MLQPEKPQSHSTSKTLPVNPYLTSTDVSPGSAVAGHSEVMLDVTDSMLSLRGNLVQSMLGHLNQI